MKFNIGDRVRVKSKEDLIKLFEEKGYRYETATGYYRHGNVKYIFNSTAMYRYCGEEYEVYRTEDATNFAELRLGRVSDNIEDHDVLAFFDLWDKLKTHPAGKK
mgnify:CR=1 FL=1